MKKTRDEFYDTDAMLAVVGAMNVFAQRTADRIIPPFGQNSDLDRERINRWSNRWQYFNILFDIYDWRYALLPIGVRESSHPIRYGSKILWVTARQLHVFGLRIARWVVQTQGTVVLPPPKARLRLRGRK